MRTRIKVILGSSIIALTGLCAWKISAWAAENPGFPIGMDAVQAPGGGVGVLRCCALK